MQAPTPLRRQTQIAAGIFVVGLLLIALPIIVTVILDNQPFPGAVVGPSEVAPVLGMLFCVIATLVIIQDLFGY